MKTQLLDRVEDLPWYDAPMYDDLQISTDTFAAEGLEVLFVLDSLRDIPELYSCNDCTLLLESQPLGCVRDVHFADTAGELSGYFTRFVFDENAISPGDSFTDIAIVAKDRILIAGFECTCTAVEIDVLVDELLIEERIYFVAQTAPASTYETWYKNITWALKTC